MDSARDPPPHCGLSPSKCFFFVFFNFPNLSIFYFCLPRFLIYLIRTPSSSWSCSSCSSSSCPFSSCSSIMFLTTVPRGGTMGLQMDFFFSSFSFFFTPQTWGTGTLIDLCFFLYIYCLSFIQKKGGLGSNFFL